MSSSGPFAAGEAPWSDLLRAASAEGGERRLLSSLLQALSASGGGGAVYRKAEQGFRRELADGLGNAADERLAEVPAGVWPFPGGFLRLFPPTPAGSESLVVATVLAARATALTEQLKRRDFEAKTRGVAIEALYDVGLAIASTLDFDKLCDEIQVRAVSMLDARRGALYLKDGARLVLHCLFGGDGVPEIAMHGPLGARLLAGEPCEASEILPGATHLLATPIAFDRDPRGILVVGDKESRKGVGPFSDADRRTLSLLATQAAIALENAELHRQALEKERLEREMELASDIQRRILPKAIPDVEGFELIGWNRPARHIGGDYFDFFRIGADRLGLLVGDVSGKGVPAALLVSTLHSALRLLVERDTSGSALFQRLNEHILDSSAPNKFITLLLAELDLASGHVTYWNAGHNPGIVVGLDGGVRQLGPGGLPLGLMPGSTYRTETVDLAPGDLLCLYSDGITEATSPGDVEFGFERLANLLADRARHTLAETLAAIDTAVTQFAEGLPQGDDQTVVLLRRGVD